MSYKTYMHGRLPCGIIIQAGKYVESKAENTIKKYGVTKLSKIKQIYEACFVFKNSIYFTRQRTGWIDMADQFKCKWITMYEPYVHAIRGRIAYGKPLVLDGCLTAQNIAEDTILKYSINDVDNVRKVFLQAYIYRKKKLNEWRHLDVEVYNFNQKWKHYIQKTSTTNR